MNWRSSAWLYTERKKYGQFPKWVNLKTNDEVDGKELLERLINLLAKARGEGGDYEIQVEK